MAHFTLPTKATVRNPRAKGYDGFIGDFYIRLAIGPDTPLTIQTAPPAPDRITTEANPEDFGEEFGKTFSRIDFSGGEGLDLAHRRDLVERDFTRFWDSRGIDIRRRTGTVQEIRLLHDTEQADADAQSTLRMIQLGGVLYWTSENRVKRTANPTAGTPTVTTEDPHATEGDQAVRDLAALGNEVYAALAVNGIHRRDSGGTWTHFSDLVADRLWSTKGRIIAASGTGLYEVAAGASSTLLHTLGPGQSWNDVTDGGAAIIAAASDGHLYAFAEEGALLTLKAQTFIRGEEPRSVTEAGGFIFYATIQTIAAGGTIARWWRATLNEAFVIAGGQVIRQWGEGAETNDFIPSRLFATRDHVYVGLVDGAETHLWRYDLATAGVSRDLIFDAAGQIQGFAIEDDRLFVSIASDGIWRQTTTFVASGYLIGPLADFFTARDKQWIGARLWTRPITGTEKARLYRTINPSALEDPDSADWIQVLEVTSGAGGDERPLIDVIGRWMAAKIELAASGDGLKTPAVRGYAFRAFPGFDDVVLNLPINVSDQVERPRRRRVRVPYMGGRLFTAIKNLEGKANAAELFRPRTRVRGIVESVSLPIRAKTRRGSLTLVSMVQVRGYKEPAVSGVVGAGTLGVGLLGVTPQGES